MTLGPSPPVQRRATAELNLILFGPPGAGKGTQADHITQELGVSHLSAGNMLRDAVVRRTELGTQAKQYMDRGDLVPDDVITGVVLQRIRESDAHAGFLLDGFPRTEAQADALQAELDTSGRRLTAALYIDVPDAALVGRLAGRRTCVAAGHPYHVDANPPKVDGVCDVDGSALVQRADDEEETVRNRLVVFHASTAPLVDYYDERGLLHRFDGTRSPTEIYGQVRATIVDLWPEGGL